MTVNIVWVGFMSACYGFQDASDVCTFCKSIIGDVQKMLTDKETEVNIFLLLVTKRKTFFNWKFLST